MLKCPVSRCEDTHKRLFEELALALSMKKRSMPRAFRTYIPESPTRSELAQTPLQAFAWTA